MEETYVTNVRLFKCLKNNHKFNDEALFLFNIEGTIYFDIQKTKTKKTELIRKLKPIWVQTTLKDALILGCSDTYVLQRVVVELLEATNLFLLHDIVESLAQEIARYLMIYYRFNTKMFWETDEKGSINRFSYVFVVDISRKFTSVEYLVAKEILVFDNHRYVLHRDDTMKEEFDDVNDDGKVGENDEYFLNVIDYMKRWKKVSPNLSVRFYFTEVKTCVRYYDMELKTLGGGTGVYWPLVRKCTELEGKDCFICRANFAERVLNGRVFTWLPKPNSRRVVWLSCGHAYHHCCLFNWFEFSKTTTTSCPQCRFQKVLMGFFLSR